MDIKNFLLSDMFRIIASIVFIKAADPLKLGRQVMAFSSLAACRKETA
jgi:hypothetical protein